MKKLKLISLILAVLMVVSMLPLAGMFSAFGAEGDIVADETWYTRETTDSTPYELEINNASELFAFALKLNEGTTSDPAFLIREDDPNNPGKKVEKQLTVKLNADIFLNAGWDAISATKSEDVAVPPVVYPVTGAVYFAGIFDGQGHVLSGLYASTKKTMTGLFGNVPTGFTATVKNVIILNSFVEGTQNGIGAIYGGIEDNAWQTDHARNGFTTLGTIENVYVEASVSGTSQGRSNLGVGGLVGGSRAGLTVTNCAFVGNVFGGPRGAAALCGQTRGKEQTGTNGNYYPSPVNVNVDGFYSQAYVVGSNYAEFPDAPQSGAGGLVGYANNGNEHFYFKNILCNNTFGTEQLDENGNEVLFSSTSKDAAGNVVDEHTELLYRTGYLYGFNFSGTAKSNDVPATIKDASGNDVANPAIVMKPQVWTFDTVYYVKTTHKIKYQTAAYALQNTATITINGTLMDYSFDKTTGVGPLFSFKDYDANKKLSDMETDVAEISYWGTPRTNLAGKQLYAHGGEYQQQLLMNKFNNECSLEKTASEDWAATLADDTKLTGWVVWSNMPLPQALADMLDNNEAAEKQGATPAVDTNWYENQTTDNTPDALTIYNADDLLAFAAAIEDGKDFAGKTVTMAASITLNEGWDAKAATVTAPATVWPLTSANKSFAGTFDGQGQTISGVYVASTGEGVGIFGNVYSNQKATIKNVAILNSYVTGSAGGVGGLIGVVHGESVTAQVAGKDANVSGYVGKTSITIDGVLADIVVVGTKAGNDDYGVGGLIGGVSSDATVKNSAFVGSVTGSNRGVASIMGSTYPKAVKPGTVNETVFNGNWEYNSLYRNIITVENVLVEGTVTIPEGAYGMASGLVGYVNDSCSDIIVKNTILEPTIDAKVSPTYTGTILGQTWGKKNSKLATENTSWDLTNVLTTKPAFPYSVDATTGAITPNIGCLKYHHTTIDGVTLPMDETGSSGARVNEEKLTALLSGLTLTQDALEDKAKTLEGWTVANGEALPTTVYNYFYTGFVGQSVTLSKDLALNIYIKTDGAAALYTGKFTFGDATEEVEVYSEAQGNNVHKFTLTGIMPWQMGETIAFECGEYTDTTSVKDYLVVLLKEDADLAAAMLRWGAASQTVEEYKTDALVTAGLELPAAPDTTSALVNDATLSGTESTEYFFKEVTMYVEDGILKIKIKMFMDSVKGREGVDVLVDGQEEATYLDYQEITKFELENRTYTVVFANIDISNMNDNITMFMSKSDGGDIVSQTMTTDMDDLVKTFLDSDATDAEKALVKAMHAVGAALAD